MSRTVIRAAEPHDVGLIDAFLCHLADALGEQHAYRADREALAAHGFGDDRLFHTLLAEHDQHPVGMCISFPEFSTWRGEPGVFIQDLVVSENLRGAGIGRRLLSTALRNGRDDWGARYLRLSVGVSNHAGIDFYDRLGMVADHDNRAMLLADDAAVRLIEHGDS